MAAVFSSSAGHSVYALFVIQSITNVAKTFNRSLDRLDQQGQPFLPFRPPVVATIPNPAALGTALLIEAVAKTFPLLTYVRRIKAEQCVFNSGLLQLADELLVVHVR